MEELSVRSNARTFRLLRSPEPSRKDLRRVSELRRAPSADLGAGNGVPVEEAGSVGDKGEHRAPTTGLALLLALRVGHAAVWRLRVDLGHTCDPRLPDDKVRRWPLGILRMKFCVSVWL